MRVTVLYNAVEPGAPKSEQDVLVQVEAVSRSLELLGHESVPLPCTLDLEAARDRLAEVNPQVVFNLVEALGGCDWLSFLAPALLDTMGLPYTGSPTPALMLSTHKLLSKERLCQAGLPTPAWVAGRNVGSSLSSPRVFQPDRPYIIKTVTEHASYGLDEQSLVTPVDGNSLSAALSQAAIRLGRACYAEQYVDGREFNLSLLAGPDGPQVLSPAEIDFSAFPPGKLRIVGSRAKWEEESFEYANTPRTFSFSESDGHLLDEMRDLARRCWSLFGLRGYARVDFRIDQAGRPWILEVNANPCLSPDAGFAAALERASISLPAAVQRILDDATRA